ncbi:MAG TPA: hypothetical protein VLX68_10760 [Chitinivibrionales bacterium]|nr:hypothetical protein [Chitinivibrionales bacterium]
MAKKNIIYPIFAFLFMFVQNACCDAKQLQDQLWILETYEHGDAATIVDNVKKDLLSKDPLVQDAGCIILLKAFEGLKKGDEKAEFIFSKLSGDLKAVGSAADIIDSRLLGWYNPEGSEEDDDDMRIYTPLFNVLGKADSKTAQGTLARSFLYLRGHPDILKMIPMSEELAAASLKRLQMIKEKFCCVYPGREFVIEMLEKDSRYGLLDLYESYLLANNKPGEKMKKEMKEFVLDCMGYGDSKNGYVIRIKAVKLAGMLVKSGENDLMGKIQEVSKNDPFYTHAYIGKAGFSVKELNYPVREACAKILQNERAGGS